MHGKYGLYILCIEFIKPLKNRSTCRGRNRKGQLFYLVVGSQFHCFLCDFLVQLFLEIQIHSARIFKEKKTICECCVTHFIPHYSGCFHKYFSKIFFDFAQGIFFSTYLLKLLYVQVPAIFLAYFLTTFRISKEREKEVQELKEENRQAEIQALKEQISPHFLFNTFNSLSALIRTDKKNESLEFIQSLSEVYRYILESQHKNLVSISEELKFLKAYTYLLQKRFEHNLVVNILIDEKKIQDSIPPLALQILVENAVKHNKLTNKVPLKIKIERTANFIEVQNNYNPKVVAESNGIGLINLAKRFHLISNQEIKINKDDKIFFVTIPIILS